MLILYEKFQNNMVIAILQLVTRFLLIFVWSRSSLPPWELTSPS